MSRIDTDQKRATNWRRGLRQHVDVASIEEACFSTTHWLMDAAYGRDLLLQKLRLVRPGVRFPKIWSDANDIAPMLDAMLDELGWRSRPRPRGLREHFLYLRWIAEQSTHIRASSAHDQGRPSSGDLA
jgi:hypothetical protein